MISLLPFGTAKYNPPTGGPMAIGPHLDERINLLSTVYFARINFTNFSDFGQQ
jgi:hypothetical protein